MHNVSGQSRHATVRGHSQTPATGACLNGALLPLSPAESGVLACLLAFRDRPVSRATLLSWLPDRKGEPTLADVLVFRLRRKFARACGRELIENVPGVGYRVPSFRDLTLTLAQPPAS